MTLLTNVFKKTGWVMCMFLLTNHMTSQGWDPMCPGILTDCNTCSMLISVTNDIPDINSGLPGAHFTGDVNAVDCADCMDGNMPAHHCYKFKFDNTAGETVYSIMHVGQGNSCEGNLDGVYTVNGSVCTATAIHPGSQTIIYPVFPPNSMTEIYLCVNSHAQVSLCDVFKAQSPLSVEMAAMEVVPLHATNMVTWSTITEWGNSYFDVEKSHDGKKWTPFARQLSISGENVIKYYTAIDYQPYDMTFYRIKSVDVEGSFVYSRIMSLQREFSQVVSVYPNPGSNELCFGINKYDHGLITVSLTDISGEQIMVKTFANDDLHTIDITSLPLGIYILQIQGKDLNFAKKFVKMEPE